jgi:hypothetical protein
MELFIRRTPFIAQLLGSLPAFFDEADGDGVEHKSAMAVPFAALDPTDGGSIRSGAQIATGDAAEIIGDDVVIADAAALAINAVEELDQLEGLDVEAGFLADFANDAGGECFTEFEHAPGEGPVALEGLCATANEEHAGVMNDNGADAYEGRRGKLAFDVSLHVRSSRSALQG